MQDFRAMPLLICLKIAAPAATKMLGLKPLAANVIILGAKQNAQAIQQRPYHVFLTRHPRYSTDYKSCKPIPKVAPGYCV